MLKFVRGETYGVLVDLWLFSRVFHPMKMSIVLGCSIDRPKYAYSAPSDFNVWTQNLWMISWAEEAGLSMSVSDQREIVRISRIIFRLWWMLKVVWSWWILKVVWSYSVRLWDLADALRERGEVLWKYDVVMILYIA